MKHQLPTLSHLQFFILSTLESNEHSGEELRTHMRQRGVKLEGPAFYQLMRRAEQAGIVRGRYTKKIENSQIIRQRRYQVTMRGHVAWTKSLAFYRGF